MFFSKTFRRLRSEQPALARLGWYLASIVAGVLGPLLIVVFGVLVHVLNGGSLDRQGLQLGDHFLVPIPPWLAEQSPLGQLSALTATALLVSLLLALSLWLHLRGLLSSTRNVLASLHEQLLERIVQLANSQGITAQRSRAEYLLTTAMPAVHSGLMAWWRSVPRSVLLLILCVLIALLVDPLLSMLAAIGSLLVWRLYAVLRGDEEGSVARWELTRGRRRLVELLDSAPLLQRMQPKENIDSAYSRQLDELYEMHHLQDRRWARLMPLVAVSTAAVIAAFVLALGTNLLSEDSGLKPASAFLLVLSLVGAAIAIARLARTYSEVSAAVDAATSVYNVIDSAARAHSGAQRQIAELREALVLQDVTLFDSHGHPLLANITLRLEPRRVVALTGSSKQSNLALVELLLGFGRPASGSVQVDGVDMGDIDPQALARQFYWVGRDGPLWNGTVEENIRGGTDGASLADLREATQNAGVYDDILELPDGMSTYVTDDDPRLDEWMRYRIAIARVLLRQPAVVIAQEPRGMENETARASSYAALRRMAERGSLVVVLPRQLITLRSVDRVVLLHGPRIEAVGTHAELLEKSDLYRHLNYLQFNPFRSSSASSISD